MTKLSYVAVISV